jgi:hypothetical protein
VSVPSPLTITHRSARTLRQWEKFGFAATVVPSLTRVIHRDGVRVILFVVRITVAHPRAAPALAAQAGYSLWARVPGITRLHFLADERPVENPSGRVNVPTYALLRLGDTLVSVVPDDVALVRWTWPQELDPSTPRYAPTVTVQATPGDNLAVAKAPRTGTPPVMGWYAADGKRVRTIKLLGHATQQ